MPSPKKMSSQIKLISAYIATDSQIMGGKPVLRGTRIPLDLIFEFISKGWEASELNQAFPGIDTSVVEKLIKYKSGSSVDHGSEKKRI